MEKKNLFRLQKRLLLDGRIAQLRGDQVRLGLGRVGEGLLRVPMVGRSPVGALAELFVGVGGAAGERDAGRSAGYQVIRGVVWQVRKGSSDWILHVREAVHTLRNRVHLQMDDCNAREVVAEIGLQCGLTFVMPKEMSLLNNRRPRFDLSNLGSEALSLVGKAWGVPGAVWSQLPDGSVYWGPWMRAPFVGQPLQLKSELINDVDLRRGIMEMPYIPAFRPGILLVIPLQQKLRVRIDELIFSGQGMRVHWTAC